jgi:plastocyanin
LLWAVATCGVVIVVGNLVVGPDPTFLAFGAIYLVAAALLWRGGRVLRGVAITFVILLSLLLVLFVGFEIPFVVSHAIAVLEADGILLVLLFIIPLLAILASVALLLERRVGFLRHPAGPRTLGALGLVFLVLMLGLGVLARAGSTGGQAGAGDQLLKIKDTKYSTGVLESTSDVGIRVVNQDSSFHTFTIDGVTDTTAPAKSDVAIHLHLSRGTYAYYCAVPGHRESMHGTLTVH